MVKELRRIYPGAALIDSGNVGDTAWKAGAVMQCMSALGYHAVGVQAADERLGRAYHELVSEYSLPSVGQRPMVRWLQATSPLKSLDGPSSADAGSPLIAVVAGTSWQAGAATVTRASRQARRAPDLLICLGPPTKSVERFAAGIGEAAGQSAGVLLADAPKGAAFPLPRNTLSLPVTEDGRDIYVIRAVRTRAQQWKLSAERKRVTTDLKPDVQLQAIADAHYQKHQDDFVRKAARTVPDTGDALRTGLDQGYVPAWACGKCHAKAFQVWQHSGHSRATETLRQRKRLEPECVTCHVEQFRRTGTVPRSDGPRAGTSTAALPRQGGVECASCHGDGVLHSALGTAESAVRGDTTLCIGCHNPKNSPKFDAVKYWSHIRH